MRSISSAEAAQDFDRLRESVLAPGAEPITVTHDNIPQVVVMSFKDYQDLLRKTRFAGKLEDLPEEDLAMLAIIDERNR
jgi:PHD/YefM family antitoxin component YafN of YafNO toxin-antitoxin module